MKEQADKKRSERVFQVNDWVFFKLQPYVQTSVAARANHKLSFRYFGPFQVLDKIGSVPYKLALPADSRVHPVFHVSLLRGALPPATAAQPDLPVPPAPHTAPSVPEAVLQRRVVQRGTARLPEVLIKWSGQPASLATWEDYFELRSRFPGAAAWGQAGAEGGGDVTAPSTSSPPEGTTGEAGPLRPRQSRKPSARYDPATWELAPLQKGATTK